MNKSLLLTQGLLVLLVLISICQAQGSLRRCYKCRSRGALGDCRNPFLSHAELEARQRNNYNRNPFLDRDPFRDPYRNDFEFGRFDPHNAFPGGYGVEAVPCSSGWCGKVVEGSGSFAADEYGMATERMCLQRPPQDLRERCATTIRGNQEVYMCFCQGDLCNGQTGSPATSSVLLISSIAMAFYAFYH